MGKTYKDNSLKPIGKKMGQQWDDRVEPKKMVKPPRKRLWSDRENDLETIIDSDRNGGFNKELA